MKELVKKLFENIKNRYGSMKIKTRIILILFIVTLSAVITVSLFLYFREVDVVEDETEAAIIGLLDQTALSTENVMNRVEDVCFRMYTNQALRNIFQTDAEEYSYWKQMEDYYTLTDIYNTHMADKYLDGISLYFKVHGTYVDMQYACRSMETAKESPWYNEVSSVSKRACWVGYESTETRADQSNYVISCIRKVTADDDTLGYIEVVLNQNIIMDILERTKASINSDVYILTEDNRVLLSSNTESNGSQIFCASTIDEMLETGESSQKLTDYENGDQKLILTREGDLLFATVVPEEGLRNKASDFIPFVIALAVLELSVVMAVARTLSNSITDRIAELACFMQNVSIEDDTFAVERYHDEITALVRSYNRMLRMTRTSISEVYKARLEKKEAELQLLQAQINPHFLYNTLDSINWMANKQKAYDISKMTRLLADFFRLALNKGESMIFLRDEFAYVQTYMEIIQMRYDEEIQVKYELDDAVLTQKTVRFILQPIVENAVMHGLMERDTPGGSILITAAHVGEKIIISVQDNGIGIKPEKLANLLEKEEDAKSKGGYGLRNVNERIKLSYGDKYGLAIQSTVGEGTQVEISIPWQDA